MSNKRGYISFATSGTDSRTTQMFINVRPRQPARPALAASTALPARPACQHRPASTALPARAEAATVSAHAAPRAAAPRYARDSHVPHALGPQFGDNRARP